LDQFEEFDGIDYNEQNSLDCLFPDLQDELDSLKIFPESSDATHGEFY